MKKETKIFWHTVRISSLIAFCLIIGFYGMSEAYKNIRRIGFGEYRNAIELEEDSIKIFDFTIFY